MLLFEEIWKQIPYFNKRFITVSVFLYLISFTTPIFTLLFINIPAVTINQYQIHRLFTTLFINIHIFQLVFGTICLIPVTVEIEKSRGSVYFLVEILFYTFALQSIYCIILYIINLYVGIMAMSYPSSGFWSLVMLYLAQNPEISTPIKSRYYPLFLLIFFCFFNIQIDLFVSAIVGIVSIYKPFDLSQSTIKNLENNSIFKYLSTSDQFILQSNAKSSSIQIYNRNHQNRSQINLPITNNDDYGKQQEVLRNYKSFDE